MTSEIPTIEPDEDKYGSFKDDYSTLYPDSDAWSEEAMQYEVECLRAYSKERCPVCRNPASPEDDEGASVYNLTKKHMCLTCNSVLETEYVRIEAHESQQGRNTAFYEVKSQEVLK